jgi:hypothetical protein
LLLAAFFFSIWIAFKKPKRPYNTTPSDPDNSVKTQTNNRISYSSLRYPLFGIFFYHHGQNLTQNSKGEATTQLSMPKQFSLHFPHWISSKAIIITWDASMSTFQVGIVRVVNEKDGENPIWQAIRADNAHLVKELLITGRNHVSDIDSNGVSLLQVHPLFSLCAIIINASQVRS